MIDIFSIKLDSIIYNNNFLYRRIIVSSGVNMVNEVRASHILVKTESEAKNIANQLKTGADFKELAKAHSDCPSGRNGGDLGYFGRGMMVKEFENAAFSMKRGQVSDPVKTQFGYHIIMITDTR